MRKILWLSRHAPQSAQINELEDVFGEVEIIQVAAIVNNADDVISLMRKYKVDDIVAVLPLTIIAAITYRGIHPIRAVMKKSNEGSETTFIHDHFDRIEHVTVTSHPLRSDEWEES